MSDFFTTDLSFLGAIEFAEPQRSPTPAKHPRANSNPDGGAILGITFTRSMSDETRAKIRAASSNPSAETRAKRSAALKGRIVPEETRAKHRGKVVSDETRAKLSASSRGRVMSAESRAKIAAASRARVCLDATRAKLRAANLGKKHSAEACAKMSAAGKGKVMSAEARAKISAARRLKGVSAETRAKIGAASRGRVHSAETLAKILAKNGQPIMTPTGVFPSIRAAGRWAVANGLLNAVKKIQKWLKTHPDQFYYIPKDAK